MIVVKLIGGLGNQMFQYAAGRALSLNKHTDLALDRSFLDEESEGFTKRTYELDPFNIKAQLGGEELRSEFDLSANRLILKLRASLPGLFDQVVFNESRLLRKSNFFNLPKNSYLNGYWQDLSYFEAIRPVLLKDFTLKMPFSDSFKELHKELSCRGSVSIHVRRGDYVTLQNANAFHGVLDLEYYEKAVKIFAGKQSGLSYYVFSDDLDWCKQHFGFLDSVTFVEGKHRHFSAQEELLLMSACNHNIIANSSFSWWAAWLNDRSDKMVMAPANWFNKQYRQPKNLIPANWLRI